MPIFDPQPFYLVVTKGDFVATKANMLLFAAITVPASILLFACVGAHPQPKEVLKHETSLHQLNLNPHGHGCQIPGRSP